MQLMLAILLLITLIMLFTISSRIKVSSIKNSSNSGGAPICMPLKLPKTTPISLHTANLHTSVVTPMPL